MRVRHMMKVPASARRLLLSVFLGCAAAFGVYSLQLLVHGKALLRHRRVRSQN